MADINKQVPDEGDIVALVELLFFAYRDFTGDPDEILSAYGFGRAHHRVVHFVGRNPGMTVAALLDILRITKQSLSRVLKELIEKGYVTQKEGAEDRRQRLLYLSPTGDALWNKLITPQLARFEEAIRHLGEEDASLYHDMLLQLISPENREAAEDWVSKADAQHG